MPAAHTNPSLRPADAVPAPYDEPRLRTITFGDVKDALARGVDDFRAMPKHLVFLAVIYPFVCLIAVSLAFNYNLLPLVFPLVSGFTLLGPFAAVGLYELSRRREEGSDTRWWHMFDVFRSGSAGSILALGFLLLAVFVLWLAVALAIYSATFGDTPMDSPEFGDQLFTTGHGWALILVGNGVGALFALLVFAMSVVSFPMLVDRRVPFAIALKASVDAVRANPWPMLGWALIVVASLAIGSIPLFVGLAVVLPILGHATWHLYRKVVER